MKYAKSRSRRTWLAAALPLLALAFAGGCGKSDDDPMKLYSSLGYEFTTVCQGSYCSYGQRSCSTGRHVFGSIEELCAGIQSASLNNDDCARTDRMYDFSNKYGCPGAFTVLP